MKWLKIAAITGVAATSVYWYQQRQRLSLLDSATQEFWKYHKAGRVYPLQRLLDGIEYHISVPGGLDVPSCPGLMAPECLARLAVDQHIIYMRPDFITDNNYLAYKLEKALGLPEPQLEHGQYGFARVKEILTDIELESRGQQRPTIVMLDHVQMSSTPACAYFMDTMASWARGERNISVILIATDMNVNVEQLDIQSISVEEATQFVKGALSVSDSLTTAIVKHHQQNDHVCLDDLNVFTTSVKSNATEESIIKALESHQRMLASSDWSRLKLLWRGWTSEEKESVANAIKGIGGKISSSNVEGVDMLTDYGYLVTIDDKFYPSSPATAQALDKLKARLR